MGPFDRKPTAPRTFADALMGDLAQNSPVWEESAPAAAPIKEQLTEKALVLESFTQYVHEKMEESSLTSLQFPGGEIHLKEDESRKPLELRFSSFVNWSKAMDARVPKQWLAMSTDKKAPLAVLFVGESLTAPEISPEGIRDEFLWAFQPTVAELFQKMVQAMKLQPHEYALTALKDAAGDKTSEELFEEAHWWQARFVVPLGAQACQTLLGARDRLATIHGKSFTLAKLQSGSEVMPLFHPGVIATNANMKKSTWLDMQKIMQSLGKA